MKFPVQNKELSLQKIQSFADSESILSNPEESFEENFTNTFDEDFSPKGKWNRNLDLIYDDEDLEDTPKLSRATSFEVDYLEQYGNTLAGSYTKFYEELYGEASSQELSSEQDFTCQFGEEELLFFLEEGISIEEELRNVLLSSIEKYEEVRLLIRMILKHLEVGKVLGALILAGVILKNCQCETLPQVSSEVLPHKIASYSHIVLKEYQDKMNEIFFTSFEGYEYESEKLVKEWTEGFVGTIKGICKGEFDSH